MPKQKNYRNDLAGYGDICPKGYMCPVGSELPTECPAGTYQDEEGQSTCKTCPEGFYCTTNSTDFSDKPCPVGHYCPNGTTHANQYPCLKGTYNPAQQQTNVSSCLECDGGKYCPSDGAENPAGNCR